MANLFETTAELLKQNKKYCSNDGMLLRNAVYEDAMRMDSDLIRLLLSNDVTKECFFKDIDGVQVFDKVEFGWAINNREFLPDSYTRFKNQIGLADSSGNLVSRTGDIEFVFPYKDCYLAGGQTKEDQKRAEVFFNQTLAPDEVDRLLSPKCLSSAERFDDKGKSFAEEYLGDNLIIKGNNLLALASVKQTHAGQIRCIYIDPPYYFMDNKSADSFGYNSNFKLSTWLVFMKNRLQIARELLSSNGSIWISVGKDGQHYLKALADEIFGSDCFVADISWQKTYSPRNDAHGITSEVESILVYSKSPNWRPNKLPRTAKMNAVYKNPDNDHTLWRNSDAFAPEAVTHQGMVYAIQHPVTGELIYPYYGAHWPLDQATMFEEISKWANYKYLDINDEDRRAQVCGIPTDCVRKNVKAIMLDESLESARNKSLKIIEKGPWPTFFFTKNGYGGIARKTYLDDSKGRVVTNFWSFEEAGHTDEAKKEMIMFFDDKVFATPKPERLIMQILQVATNEGDWVLDYHLGSGTTCAVAHQMKRKYIGIEQMDYIQSLCVQRLRFNIAGGKTNISEAVGWTGGGSFVYCELAKQNQKFLEEIEETNDDSILKDILNRILETGFISYNVDPQIISENADSYDDLRIDEKKRFLMEILDKNLLYVNYCDIDDKEFAISETDREFTKSFYRKDK